MSSVDPTPILASRILRRIALALGLVTCLGVGLAWVAWGRRPAEIAVVAASNPVAEEERKAADPIDQARSSTVALEYGPKGKDGRRRMATGVMIDDDGHVLSIRIDPPATPDPSPILAHDASGHRHRAGWLAADIVTGLTLLRVVAADVKPITPAVREPSVGAEVFLVGTPYGLVQSVSRGHVAGLDRHMTMGDQTIGGLIQLQASIHPGDSGALVADTEGGWLGLIRGVLVQTDPSSSVDDDLGFAISARDALWVAGQLIDHGKVDRAYLGVKFGSDGLQDGAMISEIVPDSPAYRAGLQPNDRVTRLDNRSIRNSDDLADQLDRTTAGAEIALEFARGDRSTDKVVIKSASRPVPPEPTSVAEAPKSSKPEGSRTGLPKDILERIERIERRLDELDRREKPMITP